METQTQPKAEWGDVSWVKLPPMLYDGIVRAWLTRRAYLPNMPIRLTPKILLSPRAILALMRKWANELGLAALAVAVASLFGTIGVWASDFGSAHLKSIVLPLFVLPILLFLLFCYGTLYLGLKDARERDAKERWDKEHPVI